MKFIKYDDEKMTVSNCSKDNLSKGCKPVRRVAGFVCSPVLFVMQSAAFVHV
jgi:hypothetical protein